MSVEYDATELGQEADKWIARFQADGSAHAGHLHHLITLPDLPHGGAVDGHFGQGLLQPEGMLGYVRDVQRQEIRGGIACVKHQNMAGSDLGDDHKEYFAGEAALKAAGADNTMNQFSHAAE